MSLKQIIIVDEEGDTVTIQSSPVKYSLSKIEHGKRRIIIGTREPMDRVLRHFVKDEWCRLKDFGARLVTKMPWLNDKEKFKK